MKVRLRAESNNFRYSVMQIIASFLALALSSATAANAVVLNERQATTTSAPTPTSTGAPLWHQCGGEGYSGPTVCADS
ncbi:hypothetical protein D9619_007843 [Psilocybe cf. subviscida]|uniref:CBM1 domain-containing protein n=1 Tax=Psilocybe cf. subviscida TaxID=2480587 RepID=A0A8H5ATE4_9AGAR|nr:hypothetical protein D9619_007843 [Psilocybe cf. subviscida]